MYVYLVQHGEAVPKREDPDRPLTQRGKVAVERVANWAAKVGLEVDQVRHSGKLRARQTAAILADRLGPQEGIAAYPGLGPKDDVRPIADSLADCPCSVLLVGHLPFLSRLTALLLTGDPDLPIVRFQNAGIVGLTREDDRWTLVCVVPPELLEEG